MTSLNGNLFCVTSPLWGVDFSHKGKWREALMFSLICSWRNSWASNRDVGDLKRHRAPYDVTIMEWPIPVSERRTWYAGVMSVYGEMNERAEEMKYDMWPQLMLLIYSCLHKMAAILQTRFPIHYPEWNYCIWIRISLKFYLSILLSISKHWLWQWLGAKQAAGHYLK